MRLIDADELLDVLRKHKGAFALGEGNEPFMEHEVEDYINDCETIDAEPVRHGRWEYDNEGHTCCSECRERLPYIHCYSEEPCSEYDEEWDEEMPESLYCPDCGAKIDGGAEE